MKVCLTILLLHAGVFAAQAEVKHTFVCLDNQKNQLVYVDQFAPEKSWKVPLPAESRDLCLFDDERVLVSHSNGAEIYRLRDGSSVQRFEGFKGVSSASRTPAGNILIGSAAGFTEIDLSGKKLRTTVSKGKNKSLRLARMLPNGNILYCDISSIHEIDPDGNVLWEHTTAGKPYLALKQNDGSILSTEGGEVKLLRIARDGTETVVCGDATVHPNAKLAWFSGYDLLPNGNIMVANWRGHGFKGESSHLFEFTPGNQIVWRWDDPEVQGVTTVQVIR